MTETANVLSYATRGKRLLAYLIDMVPVTLVTFGLLYLLLPDFREALSDYFSDAGNLRARAAFLIQRNRVRDLAFFVWIVYSLLMDCSKFQGTLGKILVGIMVVRDDGERLTLGDAIVRNIFKIISLLPFGLGFIWILFNEERKGWHDIAAKTVIVPRLDRSSISLSHMPEWPWCGAEREMKLLMDLSYSTTYSEIDDILFDGASRASRCVATSQSHGSYHSRLLFQELARSREGNVSSTSDPLSIVWLIDFEKPANFRVIQVASSSDQDAWVTIGDQHFEWDLFQRLENYQESSLPDPKYRSQINHFLAIDKWLGLLAKERLVFAQRFRGAFGRRYVRLEYQVSNPSEVLFEELPSVLSSCRGTFYAWIYEETDLLAKCELEITAQSSTGQELPHLQLQQIFAGYSHNMRFNAVRPTSTTWLDPDVAA